MEEKELSSDTLSHVARSLTLWEFMMLKLGHCRVNEQAKIAEILTEFTELHMKVKAVSHNVLTPARNNIKTEEDDTSKHVMVKYSSIHDLPVVQTLSFNVITSVFHLHVCCLQLKYSTVHVYKCNCFTFVLYSLQFDSIVICTSKFTLHTLFLNQLVKGSS